jgi:hypothetical protein
MRHGSMMVKNSNMRTSYERWTFAYRQNLEHALFLWNIFSENWMALDRCIAQIQGVPHNLFEFYSSIKNIRNKAVHEYMDPFALKKKDVTESWEVEANIVSMANWDPGIWDAIEEWVVPTLPLARDVWHELLNSVYSFVLWELVKANNSTDCGASERANDGNGSIEVAGRGDEENEANESGQEEQHRQT